MSMTSPYDQIPGPPKTPTLTPSPKPSSASSSRPNSAFRNAESDYPGLSGSFNGTGGDSFGIGSSTNGTPPPPVRIPTPGSGPRDSPDDKGESDSGLLRVAEDYQGMPTLTKITG